MPFLNDNPVHDQRRVARQKYLDDCLKNFSKVHPYNIPYSPKTAEAINKLYWDASIPLMKSKMCKPDSRIDHHKIISGTQCAIMVGSFIRTEETASIGFQTVEAKKNVDIRQVNANFALYIAFDVLEQWNNIDVTPLHDRGEFVKEHAAWLKNVAVGDGKGKMRFPFFAISQMWYLAEELCKSESLKKF